MMSCTICERTFCEAAELANLIEGGAPQGGIIGKARSLRAMLTITGNVLIERKLAEVSSGRDHYKR